ncbi:SMP-30/gluconolactonase/LRE family protein [Pedobacter metabolipauper]|uniref:Gluconolactonase n=1 Tax=Pedobacter metabolipauper TaxID=425513 RepID=A0A4R6T2H7_9SPHI|nr:SMP-30/gluconolactonase/LRE family protein [Pedobacter metabolipauper]TDQ11918.1 gluconolactonase [Pedobacter metabolipauper]
MTWNRFNFLILLLLYTSFQLNAQEQTLFNAADLKLISADFSFTEGPSADKYGNVFFTDQPNDKIWKFDTDGKLSIFLEKSGRSNGTYFDRKGNLIACADEKGEFWSITPKGTVTVFKASYLGKQLNGPNDLWIDAKGGIYFTDPYYQRPYWTRTAPDQPAENLYYMAKGSQVITLAADSLKGPNGIVGTPDGKYLYVADAKDNKTYRYNIGKDGKLSGRQLFIKRASDGMTLDERGNIYLTGNGVDIYDPQGKKVAHINAAGGTTNVCFSGKNSDVLFITAGKSIYTLPMLVKGMP